MRPGMSTALLTDHYELTMLCAALADGTASRLCTFEAFARRLPDGRRYGIVGGTGRVLDAITRFRFGDDERRERAADHRDGWPAHARGRRGGERAGGLPGGVREHLEPGGGAHLRDPDGRALRARVHAAARQ